MSRIFYLPSIQMIYLQIYYKLSQKLEFESRIWTVTESHISCRFHSSMSWIFSSFRRTFLISSAKNRKYNPQIIASYSVRTETFHFGSAKFVDFKHFWRTLWRSFCVRSRHSSRLVCLRLIYLIDKNPAYANGCLLVDSIKKDFRYWGKNV